MSRRQISPVESLRNTRRSMGDGTLGGRSRIATPYDSRRLRRATSAVSAAENTPQGELVALTGTVTVAAGGDGVVDQMDTIQSQSGFDAVVNAGDTVPLPVTAAWLVEIDVRWTDGYRGGGTVTVTLDGTAVGASWPTSGPWGRWVDQVAFAGTRGQDVDVEVAASDGAEHTAEVTFRVTMLERLRTISEAVGEPPAAVSTATTSSAGGGGATSWNVTLTMPATIVEGDQLFAVVTLSNWNLSSGAAVDPPSGWTELSAADGLATDSFAYTVFTKAADADDAAGTSTHQYTCYASNPNGSLDQSHAAVFCIDAAVTLDVGSLQTTGATINSGTVSTYSDTLAAGPLYGMVLAVCRNTAKAGSNNGIVDLTVGQDAVELGTAADNKQQVLIGTLATGGTVETEHTGTGGGSVFDLLLVVPVTAADGVG